MDEERIGVNVWIVPVDVDVVGDGFVETVFIPVINDGTTLAKSEERTELDGVTVDDVLDRISVNVDVNGTTLAKSEERTELDGVTVDDVSDRISVNVDDKGTTLAVPIGCIVSTGFIIEDE